MNGNGIIFCTTAGITRFHPPIGSRDPALMRALIRLALDVSGDSPCAH
ncbi:MULTISPECIES: hypothetical protein [unclassified Methanosarcina]|nr:MULTISPECIES: hypothetical protein [unclassified Methanosarcina]